MTNTPQSNDRNDRESSPAYPLRFEEFVAILVAFLTLGTTLFWTLSRSYNGGWNLNWLGASSSIPKSANVPTEKTEPLVSSPQLHQEGKRINFPGLTPPFSSLGNEQSEVVGKSKIFPPTPNFPIGTQKPMDSMAGKGVAAGVGAIPWISSITPTEESTKSPEQASPVYPSVGSKETVPVPTKKEPQEKDPLSTVTPVAKKPAIPTPKTFVDVDEKSWEAPFVNALSSQGIIEGYQNNNSFRPNQPVTRAEYAALLNQAFQDRTDKQLEFSDVKTDYWANEAINKAVATGFLNGYPNQDQSARIFIPERKIPRVEVLVALVTGLNLKPPADVDKVLSVYPDNDKIPQYARPKIAAATVNNIVVNPNNKVLEPTRDASRAEVAAMIHQALVQAKRIKPVESDTIMRYQ
ncbi:MAG: S-layer homology domain-containing protein [Mastigocoleus sp.]